MKQVYIIGTDHNFQTGHDSYKESASRFLHYIEEICGQMHVKAIVEEMNKDALAENGVDKSTCEIAANKLGIDYCMCDPDRTIRKALGIQQVNDIKLEAFSNRWNKQTIQEKISKENRKRENIWLEHILSLRNDPVLFVCGANHVNSFLDLLNSNGLLSEVLSIDWLPNQRVY